MRLRWFGQSAFRLEGGDRTVVIDPFGAMGEALAARGVRFAYPPVEGVTADLVLVTHEHRDHNHVEGVTGDPAVVRLAGTHQTPIGEVVGIASEHDPDAGTKRGPNAIFRFALDGLTLAHMGDFGQPALRPEQAAALQGIDVLFVPVGGGPTIGGAAAAAVVRELDPRIVVPMHYGTPQATFLEPVEPFLEALGAEVREIDGHETDLGELPAATTVLVLTPPS